jgi:hypothetical protein
MPRGVECIGQCVCHAGRLDDEVAGIAANARSRRRFTGYDVVVLLFLLAWRIGVHHILSAAAAIQKAAPFLFLSQCDITQENKVADPHDEDKVSPWLTRSAGGFA